MQTPDWRSTAVVVSYDDSDGWYDHAYSGVTNPSQSVADALTGPGPCGPGAVARRPAGPMRLRASAPAARRLTVGEARLRRPHAAPTSRRSSASSRTTGVSPGSPGASTASPGRSTTSSTSAASSASRSTSSRCPSTRRPVNTSSGSGAALPETLLSVVSPGGVDTGDEDVGERTNRGPVMSTMELHAPRPSLGEPLHRVLAGLRPVLQRALTRSWPDTPLRPSQARLFRVVRPCVPGSHRSGRQ